MLAGAVEEEEKYSREKREEKSKSFRFDISISIKDSRTLFLSAAIHGHTVYDRR